MTSRSVGVLAAIGILAAWLVAAAGIGPAPVPSSRFEPTSAAAQADPHVAQIESQARRLQGYLATAPPLRPPVRDPFRFGTRPARAVGPGVRQAQPTSPHVPPPPAAAIPLSLVGIAEDGAEGAIVRTAVLSGQGQVFLAKEGDEIGGRFRVVRIGPDAVSLTDGITGTTTMLALR